MSSTPSRRQSASSAAASKSCRARRDLLGELGADAGHVAELRPARRRARARPTRTARAAPGRSAARRPGPSSGEIRSSSSVSGCSAKSSSSGEAAAAALDRAASGQSTEGRQHRPDVVGAGRVGQLDRADRARQDEADLAAAVLLVAAHGLDQAVGIEPGIAIGRPNRSSKPDQAVGDRRARSSPAVRPAGTRRPCPTATASPCWNGTVVAGDRLDRVPDRVAEVEDARSPVSSRSSWATTSALIRQLATTIRRSGLVSPPRIASTLRSRSAKNSASRITPYLTTSARPQRSSRSGRSARRLGVDPDARPAGGTRR